MEILNITDQSFDKDYPKDIQPLEDGSYVGSLYDVYCKGFNSGMDKGFINGYMMAVSTLIRMTGDATGTIECELFSASFTSLKSLKEAGVQKEDLEILKPTIKEVLRKRDLLTNQPIKRKQHGTKRIKR